MKLNLIIVTQLTAIASGLAVAGFQFRVVDSAGAITTAACDLSVLGTPDENGRSSGTVDTIAAGAVAVGGFSGTMQAVDTQGNPIGPASSFSGTMTSDDSSAPPIPPAPNMQPLPFSVTPQIVANS